MKHQHKELLNIVIQLLLIVSLILCIITLFVWDYHYDKHRCLSNGGIWSEQMSTGDTGFTWKCIENPHIDVTLK